MQRFEFTFPMKKKPVGRSSTQSQPKANPAAWPEVKHQIGAMICLWNTTLVVLNFERLMSGVIVYTCLCQKTGTYIHIDDNCINSLKEP